MGFSIAPGTLDSLSTAGRHGGAYYLLYGDLSQMGIMKRVLQESGRFPTLTYADVYPGFAKDDEENYVRALCFLFERRVAGWWNQREKLIRYGICTEDEYKVVRDRGRV